MLCRTKKGGDRGEALSCLNSREILELRSVKSDTAAASRNRIPPEAAEAEDLLAFRKAIAAGGKQAREAMREALEKLDDKTRLFNAFVTALHAIASKLPRQPLGKNVSELNSVHVNFIIRHIDIFSGRMLRIYDMFVW